MTYKLLLVLLLIGCIAGLDPTQSAYAQKAPLSSTFTCGTPGLTSAQALSLVQLSNQALARKKAFARTSADAITYIPIRPHIIRRSDGTGGFSLNSLNQVMAKTNNYFLQNGSGVQFYFAGSTPDYIDDDELFSAFPYGEGNLVNGRDADNALNQYYVNRFAINTIAGYAYFPFDGIVSTRSFILASMTEDALGNQVIPHELGHTFNLAHTFGFSNGEYATDELVTRGAGANCTLAGDLICDTPADPFSLNGRPAMASVDGCPVYSPTNLARDANGEPYSPSVGNIMSYYFGCTPTFTSGQYDRMQAGLALRQTHTFYSLTYPPATVPAPTNLAVTLNGNAITLTWQDNATNEMGYFVERSTSPTTGFVYVGGVGTDMTTFVDTDTKLRSHYYYRIRPSNTTNASISQIVDIATPASNGPVTGLTTTNVTAHEAQLNWTGLGANITYDVRWRVQGSSTWNSVHNTAQTTMALSSLTSYTAYEWQVKATDNDTYSGPVTFTTLCPTDPLQYTSSSPTRVAATLYWGSYTDSFQSYTLQYRAQGSPTWTTISSLTGSTYSLTGLTSNTGYEWQVQGVCSATASAAFTSPQSFTTYSCLVPYTNTNAVKSSSAVLSWYSSYEEPNRTFELRYRPVGNPTWITLSDLTAKTYSLTGLANNTQYEWQVKSICSATESSAYSPSATFTTFCLAPVGANSTPTATTVFLSFGYAGTPEAGSIYQMQFRQAGSSDWTLFTGNLTGSYTGRTVTGLATNTTYEWRVRTACTATTFSDYSSIATFTTGCFAPSAYNLQVNSVQTSSADLAWYLSADPGTTYALRYRPVGTSDWTTLNSLTATGSNGSVHLTGLPNNTEFEWQLKLICSATESSTFTAGPNFTTHCLQPASLTSFPKVASALLSWNQTEPGSMYDVWYRQTGTIVDWTMVSNLTSTSLTVSDLFGNANYEWQVRARCVDGSYSGFSTATFRTSSCDMPFSLVVKANTTVAHFSWYINVADVNTRFELAYKTLEDADYTYIAGLSTDNGFGTFDLTGLTPNKQYKWMLRTICSTYQSSAPAIGADFFTRCSIPLSLNAVPHPTAATLTWTQPGYGVTYDLRYRLVGTTNWSTISNLTSTSAMVGGLTTNSSYEWQVRTRCGDGGDSEFSSIAGFTTTPCVAPFALYVANLTTTSARLTWIIASADTDTRYEGRYRLVGASDWITLTNLSSDNGIGTFDLTGLAVNSQYEWQIKTICSATSSSNFTSSNLFQTINPCPSMYTVKAGSWSDPTVWSCGRIPLSSDQVQIKHVVTIPASYQAQVKRVSYDAGQQLIFGQGSVVQFGQ